VRAWVGYDGDCGLCRGSVRRWRRVFERRGFVFVPLQDPWLRARLGLADVLPLGEMKLLFADGRIAGGMDAIAALCRAVWWLAPSGWLVSLPGLIQLARLVYRGLAQRRHRFGACKVPAPATPHRPRSAFLDPP